MTLNAESSRNALSLELMDVLTSAIRSQAAAPAIVLKANGPVFSSGHDLREIRAAAEDPGRLREIFQGCERLMTAIRDAPPVIAAVQGPAHAAGCQIVATCDLVLASPKANFATPGVRIGLFCHTPAVAVARAIGARQALPMLLLGSPIGAQEALRLGLVTRVLEPEEDLGTLAADWAGRIARGPRREIREGKRVFYAQAGAPLEQAYSIASDAMVQGAGRKEAQEGISAFLEKRPASWRHRCTMISEHIIFAISIIHKAENKPGSDIKCGVVYKLWKHTYFIKF